MKPLVTSEAILPLFRIMSCSRRVEESPPRNASDDRPRPAKTAPGELIAPHLIVCNTPLIPVIVARLYLRTPGPARSGGGLISPCKEGVTGGSTGRCENATAHLAARNDRALLEENSTRLLEREVMEEEGRPGERMEKGLGWPWKPLRRGRW